MDPMTTLDKATTRYRETETAHDASRDAATEAVVEALRAGERPTDVTARSPFTAAYVRRIARDNGIEPAKPGPKKRPPAVERAFGEIARIADEERAKAAERPVGSEETGA